MIIGERIRERREAKNLRQSQLAELIGNDGNTISRWEHNKIGIGSKYLIKLAQALETSTDYLLGKTNDPSPSEASEQTLSISQLNEKLKDEESTLENHIYGGTANNMFIIKEGEREYRFPNNEEGRKAFLSVIQSALLGMGVKATIQDKNLSINNGSNSIYKDSTVNNGVPTVIKQGD